MDPHTATCFKTCKSSEFKDQVNIIYSTAEWTKFAPVIDNAINANTPDSDQAALESVAKTAGIDVPGVIARLFTKPIAHPGVVEQPDIEAEILKFLETGN
jgi:threonine synthase